MKKFLLMFLFIIFSTNVILAETEWYKTTSIAIKYKKYNSYNNSYYWTDWSDWEECVCLMTIDFDNDIINIYSNKTQIYKILATENSPYDSSGKQIKFKIIDQDNDVGYLRLRIENNGNSQIYIDFSDIMWVYNVIKIQR